MIFYGALVKHICVCEGYSRAMQYLCRELGIPCGLVSGIGQGGPHMWNIINPGDGLYYTDVTFDDSIENSVLDLPGLHNYFNITKEQLQTDHILDGLYVEFDNGHTVIEVEYEADIDADTALNLLENNLKGKLIIYGKANLPGNYLIVLIGK